MGMNENKPRSASEWYDLGCIYRKNGQFGEAVNAFRSAVESAEEILASALEETQIQEFTLLRDRSLASIELVTRITGFVNKDLMNP